MGYGVDPDPAGEPAHMVDLKPLRTGSVRAHNVEAEQAVEDSAVEPAAETLVPVDEADSFEAEVPEVVRQQEDLADRVAAVARSEEHTSELQSLMRISSAVFCLKKTNRTEHRQPTKTLTS